MKLKYAKSSWKSNKTILKGIMWTTIGMYLGLLIFSLLSIYNKQGFISSYYACSGLPQPEAQTGLTLTGVAVLGFLLITISSSVAMDLLALWKLKSLELKPNKNEVKVPIKELPSKDTVDTIVANDQETKPQVIPRTPRTNRTQTIIEFFQESKCPKGLKGLKGEDVQGINNTTPKRGQIVFELPNLSQEPAISNDNLEEDKVTITSQCPERKIIDEMPIRSSLCNTLFLVPYIFIVIVLAQIGGKFLDRDKRNLMGIPFFIMTIGRTWLVATLTFQKNDSNKKRNAKEERERKRDQW